MKNLTLSLLTLCFALAATAEPVGKQAALYTARSYMLAKGKQVSVPQNSSRNKASSADETGVAAPYYYVFNAGSDGGYVIVSGDDRTDPILGYVEQGSFDPDNIPENMRSWLQFYEDQIKYIIDNDVQLGDPAIKKRNKVSGTKHSVPELMKTRWNQSRPYNLTCPKYYKGDGSQASPATGCAATALAQVIAFYKYPAKLKQQIPSHSRTYKLDNGTEKTVTAKAVPRNTAIDWANMRDTYSWQDETTANAQDTAVANLMLYCGQALKMGWGASSGADTSKSRDVLVNYFGFDSRAYWASRSSYTIDEWFDMLYDEMEAGYPVLYRGHSSGGGHAFVIDGFDGDNLFHVNWGWGGGSNGWFLIGILNPGDTSGMGASSSSDGYSMTQGGVFNLRTPDTPKDEAYLTISDVTVNGNRITAKFTNKTGSVGSFHTGIVMLDEDGEFSLVGTRQSISNMANGSSATKSFTITNKHLTSEGIYKLSPASKQIKNDIWHPKYTMHSANSQYILAIVDSLKSVSMYFNNPTQENIFVDTVAFPGTRIVNQEQEVKVTFRNDGAEYFKTIYLFASKTSTKTYTDSKSMVAVRTGETIDVSYFFKPEETGTYNLWLCTDDKGSNVLWQGTIDVITEAEAVKPSLSVTSYAITNIVNGIVYGKRFIGKAVIKNNGQQDYHGNVKFQIWSQKIGSTTARSGSTHSYNVNIPKNKTDEVAFEFDNLNDGYYYRFKVMYGSQEGTLSNGGLWDNKWEMRAGLLTWNSSGVVAGKPYSSSITSGSTIIGLYADCNDITRVTPNRNNVNVIYAFADGMAQPAKLDTLNVVLGSRAESIRLVSGKPYYIPVSFNANSASFTYSFDDAENGTQWHAFTMPFSSDSIYLDGVPVSLTDSLKHFWIYEFAAEGDNGEVIFAPARKLLASTPYIIAGDIMMAGRSLIFRSVNVPFYRSGTDKMLVTSPNYSFHGNTYSPKLSNCYMLNADGTAFEYVTASRQLAAMAPYFTCDFADTEMPASIPLPEIPISPDNPSAIVPPFKQPDANGIIYDLSGRQIGNGKLSGSKLPKGIYIIGGKKVLR